MRLKTLPCPYCRGTGQIPDDRAVGAEMRRLRERSGKSLRAVAGRLGVSAAYLSDLEQGRRRWSEARIKDFQREVAA